MYSCISWGRSVGRSCGTFRGPGAPWTTLQLLLWIFCVWHLSVNLATPQRLPGSLQGFPERFVEAESAEFRTMSNKQFLFQSCAWTMTTADMPMPRNATVTKMFEIIVITSSQPTTGVWQLFKYPSNDISQPWEYPKQVRTLTGG